MNKKELITVLNDVLLPIGFKNKSNYWVINENEITKMINLQKSHYSESYYINYGYIIKSIPLDNLIMHIYNRLASIDEEENRRITELLDLTNNITNEERKKEMKIYLYKKLISNIQLVNTEADLLNELKKRQSLNNIPLVVKKHYNLS